MNTGSEPPIPADATPIYSALEVSNSSWVLAIGHPTESGKISIHQLPPHDVEALLAKLRTAQAAAGNDPCVPRVLLTYEAGYEGFWLARRLADEDVAVIVCDPASLEVVRRRKKAKTDRLDARKRVRALKAWDGGDRDALSLVRVPTVAQEDAKRLLRHRERLVRDRRRYQNSICSLLRLHGISAAKPGHPDFENQITDLVTGYGMPLPPLLTDELRDLLTVLALLREQLQTLEAEKQTLLHTAGFATGAALTQLRGIGANDALLLSVERFYRDFNNRRELASFAGLAPVPWASGGVNHDQGISKCGSGMVRKHRVQMAWRWVRYQPESALTRWYLDYVSARDGRSRKRGIVALARKLLIALWRCATQGIIPTGAILSATSGG